MFLQKATLSKIMRIEKLPLTCTSVKLLRKGSQFLSETVMMSNKKKIYNISSQQQTRRKLVAVDEEELIALEDHRKQHDDRIHVQDERTKLLEEKIEQIETQGNNATRSSMMQR